MGRGNLKAGGGKGKLNGKRKLKAGGGEGDINEERRERGGWEGRKCCEGKGGETEWKEGEKRKVKQRTGGREMEWMGGEEGEGEREVEVGEKERRWKGLGRKGCDRREKDEWEEES